MIGMIIYNMHVADHTHAVIKIPYLKYDVYNQKEEKIEQKECKNCSSNIYVAISSNNHYCPKVT